MQIKKSTAVKIPVFMCSSVDHISGVTGLSAGLTITIAKNNGNFAAITPTVVEPTVANGWYWLAITTELDTACPTIFHITGAGCDPSDFVVDVVAKLVGDLNDAPDVSGAVAACAVPGSAMTLTAAYDAAKSAAPAGAAMTLTSAYDAAKTAASATAVGNIPTTPLLAANYTAPDNTTITNISTAISNATYGLSALKTAIGLCLQATGYTAPNNTEIAEIWKRLGLDSTHPVDFEPTSITFNGITLTIAATTNGYTVTRS